MDGSPWPVVVGGIVAVLGYLFGWLTNRKKANVDESAIVLGKWKELVETHQTEIKNLKDEFSSYRRQAEEELEALRKRLRDVEAEFSDYRRQTEKRMQEMENENAGLRRMIAQNTQSLVYRIGGNPAFSKEDQEAVERLDRAGDNRRGDADA